MTGAHVAVLAYLAVVVLGVLALAILRGLALGWPWVIGPALLAGVVALGVGGHVWWRRNGGGR